MSKNISIAEGGVARQFTNDKLKINLVGGGTEYYVPESGVQLTTKSVTANGTYKASDVGKYGFSQFSVNVRGAAGSADSSGKPTTSGGTAPGGAGSAVVGTDPETGNDYAVGVDSNGNLVQTPVPSGIEIVTEPTKTSYVYQETMDYTGIVVSPIKRDQSTFVDDRYSGGHIPFSELIFPVEKAPAASGELGWSADSAYIVPAGTNVFLGKSGDTSYYKMSEAPCICYFSQNTAGQGWNGPVCIGIGENVSVDSRDHTGVNSGNLLDASLHPNYPDIAIYYNPGSQWQAAGSSPYPAFDATNYIYETAIEAVLAAAHFSYSGSGGSSAIIPVKWNNPYTGATHQDTFQITSTPSTGSSSTTTGSSGTEGSGGGGSF